MIDADLQSARSHLNGLEAVLAKSHGGWADEESLLEFRRLCRATLLATGGECRQQVDLLVQCAKDLYSDRGHHRWDLGPVLGADILRRKIRMTLRALARSRSSPSSRAPGSPAWLLPRVPRASPT